VGRANGFAGGWGNLGGGATHLIMPLVFELIKFIGSTHFVAWRIAFFIPGLMQTGSAIALLMLGQDMPDGNYKQLHKAGEKHEDSFAAVKFSCDIWLDQNKLKYRYLHFWIQITKVA
jgi:MFS transporter, NNP family, nitrate/nitrite transporter